MSAVKKCLIIEDVSLKFEEIKAVIMRDAPEFEVVRASSVVEALDHIEAAFWDLLVVDISMDINSTQGATKTREAYANLGGLDVIEEMFLLEKEMPTIIVTGFDYFVKTDKDANMSDAQTFADLEFQARRWLGAKLRGCIRYGKSGWEEQLVTALRS